MANDWTTDPPRNPYRNPDAPASMDAPAWQDAPRNPYRNPDAPPGTGAAPWQDMPRNPYDTAATVARDADKLEALGRVEADKAERDRAAIEKLVGSKKSGKAAAAERAREAPKAESADEKRLRLYRELHALDEGNDRFARDMGRAPVSEAKAERDLATIDRGTEKMARDLGMRPSERDMATIDRGTADLAQRLRMAAPRYQAAPPPPPPPVEADPRLRALDAGNARFGATLAQAPTLSLNPNLRY